MFLNSGSNLVSSPLGCGGLLLRMQPKPRTCVANVGDTRTRQETAHPEVVIECQMQPRLESAHPLVKRASNENLRLHPLAPLPPNIVNIEQLAKRLDAPL